MPCSVPFRSVPFRSVLFCSVPFRSVPFRSVPFRSVPFRSVPFRSVPFRSVPLIKKVKFFGKKKARDFESLAELATVAYGGESSLGGRENMNSPPYVPSA